MKKRSLGMIETGGYVPAVEAADAGTKAANVTFLGYEITNDALVTVKFIGDVAAVKTAVTAGAKAASKVGKVVAVHVIPRPDPQLRIEPPDKLPPPVQPPREEEPETKPEPAPPREEEPEAKPEPVPPREEEPEAKPEPVPPREEEPEAKPEPAPPREEEVKAKPWLPPFPKGKEKKPVKARPIRKSKKTK